MKLIAAEIDWTHEAMKRENRKRNVYPPPDDGREWILLDDAAEMAGVQPKALAKRARKQDWTHTCRHGTKVWLLKKDVDFYLDFIRKRENWRKRRRPKHWIPEIGDISGMTDEAVKDVFLTTQQAAAYMGVSARTVRRWVTMGRIPVYL
ncbi:helix-turn-helix domain-containing protein, partial [Nostoc sp. CHAB 5824]|nr:helix-turn-helix domain-containing protein [Nostoc sp. CHAB 5824]